MKRRSRRPGKTRSITDQRMTRDGKRPIELRPFRAEFYAWAREHEIEVVPAGVPRRRSAWRPGKYYDQSSRR